MFRTLKLFRDRRQVKPEPAPPANALPPTSTLPDGKPDNFGECWNRPHANIDWFTWMYDSRIEQHRAFQQWFKSIDREQRIESVLEFGCGLAVGYADFFADRAYTGADIAPHLMEWCRANRPNSLHTYLACDFVAEPFPDKYDLVFSHGTIDNNYDMDEFLRAAVRASRRWVFLTAYRGFSPNWPITGWNGVRPTAATITISPLAAPSLS